ncbi:MAG: DUF3298 domain-containing protein [Blastocatellia bacterium]
MTLKMTVYLLALALSGASLQSYRRGTAKSDTNARPVTQNQTPPQPDSQQANETVVPAPSKFSKSFAGSIGKHAVHMKLEREGTDLTGEYFYVRAGVSNVYGLERTLKLKGRIDGDGNATLTETSDETGSQRKTGEFKGKFDSLSANGEVRLRFSGSWTGGKNGKQMLFSLQQFRSDLGGLKLDVKEAEIKNKKLHYEIKTKLPHLAGVDPRGKAFNQAVTNLVAPRIDTFKEHVSEPRETNVFSEDFYLNVACVVEAANKDFISVLFIFVEYTGGARPSFDSESLNYDLNHNSPISLDDLFTPNSNYLKVISDYSIKELKKQFKEDGEEWDDGIERGAGPEASNFHTWNITPDGLKITFDPGQVSPYIGPDREVFIPYSVLKPIIKPDGLLAQFAR